MSQKTATEVSTSTLIEFVKYQGLGNDFILVNNPHSTTEPFLFSREESKKLCDRNFGIGADGLLFICPGTHGCDYTMRMYNADGSEPQMCGNAIRCMARYIYTELRHGEDPIDTKYRIWTLAGEICPVIQAEGRIQVDMGPATLEARLVPTLIASNAVTEAGANAVVNCVFSISVPNASSGAATGASEVTVRVTAVSMGNPHAVVFVDDLLHMAPAFDVLGPLLEAHRAFPERVNVEFVQVVDSRSLLMKVWERGVGATLACGTGACAAVVAAVLVGRCPADADITVALPGGDLVVKWDKSANKVYKTGPAEAVFSGMLRR